MVSLSTITNIVSLPSDLGMPSTKSKAMTSQPDLECELVVVDQG